MSNPLELQHGAQSSSNDTNNGGTENERRVEDRRDTDEHIENENVEEELDPRSIVMNSNENRIRARRRERSRSSTRSSDREEFGEDDTFNLLRDMQSEIAKLKTENAKLRKSKKVRFDDAKYVRNVPKFSGSVGEEFESWASRIKIFLNSYNLTEATKVQVVNSAIDGEARGYIDSLRPGSIDSLGNLLKALRDVFGDKTTRRQRLANCIQQPDESIKRFALRIRLAAMKNDEADKEAERDCLHALKYQSLPEFHQLLVNCLPGTTFSQAVEHAIEYELGIKERSALYNKTPVKRKSETLNQISMVEQEDEDAESKSKKPKRDFQQELMEQLNELKSEMRQNSSTNSSKPNPPRRNLTCFFCARSGHRFMDCRQATKKG